MRKIPEKDQTWFLAGLSSPNTLNAGAFWKADVQQQPGLTIKLKFPGEFHCFETGSFPPEFLRTSTGLAGLKG